MVIDFATAVSPYLTLAGFIVGLGAVTVIDILGWLGRYSPYWTEATTRTHKVTKPLIWLGMTLVLFGGALLFARENFPPISWYFFGALSVLIVNGLFLSFAVSPFLLQREREGLASEPLPASWQQKIAVSFVVSFLGWWSTFLLVVWFITS